MQRMHRMGKGGAQDVSATVSGSETDSPVLRHGDVRRGTATWLRTAQGIKETRRQTASGGGATPGEQNLSCTEQLDKSQGGTDQRTNNGQCYLLSAKNAGRVRPAIGNFARCRRTRLQDCLFLLLRSFRRV